MRRILLLTTGGTIACRDSGHGLAPALTAEDLLAAVPAVTRACEVEARALFNLDSTDMTPKEWMTVAAAIRDAYSHFDGFMITHAPIPWPMPPLPFPVCSATAKSPSC